jgi:hypothetical protein
MTSSPTIFGFRFKLDPLPLKILADCYHYLASDLETTALPGVGLTMSYIQATATGLRTRLETRGLQVSVLPKKAPLILKRDEVRGM